MHKWVMFMKKNILKMLSFVFSLVLIMTTMTAFNLSVAMAATEGNCGAGTGGKNATWSYNADTATLTISGTGATKDYNAALSKAPWESYKDTITTLIVNEGITEIGNYNFYNCTALKNVSLPSTLTSLDGIGLGVGSNKVGYGCFQACTALESITLPGNLTTIEDYVFAGCTSLKQIVIPDSVTSLGDYAFLDCTSLNTVTFGDGLTSTGSYAFYQAGVKKINWGANITAISDWSFYGCGMTAIELPEQITSVGTRGLANCYFLSSITVNNANTTFSGDSCNGSNQTVTIYGHSGSTAEEFASKYEYEFVSIDACNHPTTHEVIALEATCTETGILQNVCDNCNAVVSESTINANGHSYEVTETVDNTDVDGHIYTTETCSVCGDIKETVTHQKAPEGSETRYVWKEGYYTYTNSATCTRPGTERYTCTVEGCYILGNIPTYETLSASLGSHTVEEYTVTLEPTCTTEGSQEGVCTVCGETVTQAVPATGHSYTEENLLETIDNSAEDGHIHKIYECQNCHEQIDETEHVEWIEGFYTPNVISEAHCVIDGLERDTCDICSKTRTVTLPANGQHEWYVTSTTEPTCTAVGKIYYACKNCTLTKSEDIAALGHDYVKNDASSKAATCTDAGYDYFTCSRCSATKQQTVAALGHTVDENNYVETAPATCEEDGAAVSVCTVCSETFDIILPALGHDYQDVVVDLTSENKPGHSLVTPTCSRCKSTTASSTRHDEWIEGYYTNSSLTSPTCILQGTTRDTCTICKTTRINYLPALGHNYNYTGELRCDGMRYRCSICYNSTYIDANEVFGYWDTKYVNSRDIHRTGTDITSYLDANGDGIINAKDYAIIRNAVRNMPEHIYEDTVTAPTCTEEGYTAHTCSVCGDVYKSDYTAIDETAHSFSAEEEYCLNGCGAVNPDYVAPPQEETNEE